MTTEQPNQEFTYPAKPTDQHRWLQRLVGEWTSEGQASMGPGQPAEIMRGTATARPFGDLWLLIEERDPAEVGERRVMFTFGYDTQKERFVGTFLDSGATYLWPYEGWLEGDVLTLEAKGPSMTGPGMATYRDVFEIVSDDHWVLRAFVHTEGDGQWQQFMTSHYRLR
jgi:hypothetical protein